MTRRENDNYTTNLGLARWAVKHAAKMALFKPGEGRMLEPCCGDDAPFATAAKEIGMEPFGFDIRDVKPKLWEGTEGFGNGGACCTQIDITKYDPKAVLYDVIATNPPFTIGEEVVRKSLDMLEPHGAAVFLVKMAFLGTQARSKLFRERPPAEVWILTARPSFTGDGNTDIAQEYAFVFWNGAHTDALIDSIRMRTTKLYWLNSKLHMTSLDKPRVRIEKGGS